MNAPNLERLTIAPTSRDADRVARILDNEGLSYEERLDAAAGESRTCYLGRAFFVASADLPRARLLLATHGVDEI